MSPAEGQLRIHRAGAGEGTRTLNLRITNPMLYHLSYASLEKRGATIDRVRPRWQAPVTAPGTLFPRWARDIP